MLIFVVSVYDPGTAIVVRDVTSKLNVDRKKLDAS